MTAGIMPHIALPEDLGIGCAVLPGDPARVERVARYLENTEPLAFNREYKSIRGRFHGVEVLVISTGMGGPSTAIAVEELAGIGVHTMVRIGSCGALQPELKLGDLVLVSGAVREEGTSVGYAPLSYPAVPDYFLLSACRESAQALQVPCHIGIGRSHDCLYGDSNPSIYQEWSKRGVIASDMETAALFVTGTIRGVRTASILNVVSGYQGNVAENVGKYQSGEEATALGEKNEILTALMALERISCSRAAE